MASAYGMAFLEPKDPVRLRWLGEQVRAGRFYAAFLALDCWMLSYAATVAVGLVLAVVWAATLNIALAVLAMLGFLTRDIGIFLLARFQAGAKGDFAALAILAALYRTDEMKGHMKRALDNGVTETELKGLITHVAFYAGWPCAVNAGRIAIEVFGEK